MLVDTFSSVPERGALRAWTASVVFVASRRSSLLPTEALVVDDVLLRRHGACWSSCAGGRVELIVIAETADDAFEGARRRWYYLAEELGLQTAPVEITVEAAR